MTAAEGEGRHKAKEHQGTRHGAEASPRKGCSGPAMPAGGMWITDEPPGQALPEFLTYKMTNKAEMVILRLSVVAVCHATIADQNIRKRTS